MDFNLSIETMIFADTEKYKTDYNRKVRERMECAEG